MGPRRSRGVFGIGIPTYIENIIKRKQVGVIHPGNLPTCLEISDELRLFRSFFQIPAHLIIFFASDLPIHVAGIQDLFWRLASSSRPSKIDRRSQAKDVSDYTYQ